MKHVFVFLSFQDLKKIGGLINKGYFVEQGISAHTGVFKKVLGPDWLCCGLIHLNVWSQVSSFQMKIFDAKFDKPFDETFL